MPVYRFRLVPGDAEVVSVTLKDDDAARAEANRTLRDLLFDAAADLRLTSVHVEVRREDGSLLADITARTSSDR